jgi:hypothetical protein
MHQEGLTLMPRPNPSTWLPILDRALQVEIGIGFAVSGVSREQFRQTLYDARKQAADPKYDELILFLPGGDHTDEVWVCKKEVELGEGA